MYGTLWYTTVHPRSQGKGPGNEDDYPCMRLRSSGNRERSGSNMVSSRWQKFSAGPSNKAQAPGAPKPLFRHELSSEQHGCVHVRGDSPRPSSASRTASPSRVLMSLTGCALSWLPPASKATTPVTASGLAPQPPRVPPASPTRLLGPSDAGPATRIWCTSAPLRRLCARPPVVWPPLRDPRLIH